MDTFKLLMPHEVINRWVELRTLLSPAVDQGRGEVDVDDIRELVLGGRMFVHASDAFATVCEFTRHPRLSAMILCYGAGNTHGKDAEISAVLCDFARRGGASVIRTYCKNPAMQRYYRRWFQLDPVYTVLEKQL